LSRVSHFQRFSQPENHATNNTLLVLRYFYQSSPFKIERVLSSLLETDLSIGLTFEQQIRGDASVPDALIAQESMKIFIETKRGGFLDADQIRRHLRSIAEHAQGRGEGAILIGLTKEPIAESDRKALAGEAAAQGVTFAAVTFSQVVEALRAQCAEYERELLSIVDDYEGYLAEEGLLEERNQWLVVFPCGTSIAENVRFGIYYEPSSRRCKRNYRFIGTYTQKTVTYVGTVEAIAVASFEGGEFGFVEESGTLDDDRRKRIVDTVEQTPYYELKSSPHRYYLVDSFVPTNARKVSAGGIMGMRYLDLTKLAPVYNPRKNYSSAELATLLKTATWE
jgi:hypothetical protein